MNIKTANRLCELRKAHNLSQEELASKLGVSRQAVSKWERSESSPDTDNLIELAKIYNLTLDELLNGEDAIELIKENKEANECDGVLSDDENNRVLFKDNDIILVDGKTNEEVSVKETIKNKKLEIVQGALTALSAFLLLTSYILLGFFLPNGKGWTHYWFLLILIPIIPSFFDAIKKKKFTEFAFPVLIVACYCALGMFLGLWHPLWVIFLLIPAFYILFDPIDKHNHKDYPIHKHNHKD